MSRDIYVQDIPPGAAGVSDIPSGWRPAGLPFGPAEVHRVVAEIAPGADFSDPTWGHVQLPGVDIEINIRNEDPLRSFALHVRAQDGAAADAFISALLGRLGVRAFDPEGAELTGIFGNG